MESSWSRDLPFHWQAGSLTHGQPLHSFLYSKILFYFALVSFVVVQSLSHVFSTPWTAVRSLALIFLYKFCVSARDAERNVF